MQATDTVILGEEYAKAQGVMTTLVAELERALATNDLVLPSLPEVALKVRKALADEAVSSAEIARLLGTDPALAARVLKTANSALFYRGSKPITSLNHAVARLGQRMVRNVAVSFAAQQVFIGYGNGELREYLVGIWQHSVHVAALSHMLARVKSQANPDDAFLAGLLHEIGKLYILARVKNDANVLRSTAEFQSVLAAWHPRVGAAVLEAWELAAELVTAVRDHETCELAAGSPPSLTEIVAVANYLAEHSAPGEKDETFFERAPHFGALALDKETFDWLVRAGDVDMRLLLMTFGV